MTETLPPVAVAISFVDQINRRDLDSLAALMSTDHSLEVFDEAPLAGKEANTNAWRGYFDSFPRYVVYPHRIAERHGSVAILGHTTGSHLELPDDEERKLTLIWIADTDSGTVTRWKIIEDNAPNRQSWGLDVG
jgi:ketosteroid isomerase-like protein